MTQNVYWTIHATLHDGKLDDLKELMGKMVELTNGESGALNYEWSISADQKTLYVFERYADSAAVMAHMANVGPHLPTLMEYVTLAAPLVLGAPDDTVKAAFADFGATYGTEIGGFAR
jgi:quinol monooxygenase YgiN